MRIREDFTIGHPADAVWSFLCDPERVASCIPGLDVEAGRLALDVGGAPQVLAGSASADLNPGDLKGRIDLRGSDPDSGGRARARVDVSVEDHGLFSTVHLDADVTLTGALGDLARTGLLAEAAYAGVDRFAECVERRLGGDRPASAAPPAEGGRAIEPVEDAEPEGWLQRLLGRFRGRA